MKINFLQIILQNSALTFRRLGWFFYYLVLETFSLLDKVTCMGLMYNSAWIPHHPITLPFQSTSEESLARVETINRTESQIHQAYRVWSVAINHRHCNIYQAGGSRASGNLYPPQPILPWLEMKNNFDSYKLYKDKPSFSDAAIQFRRCYACIFLNPQ